jgi:DNA-binding HxlR family transcriptional regulator
MSDDTGHARHRLVPQFNSPVRLSIMAALAAVDDMEFGVLRDTVEVSDSVLSRQLTALEADGFVHLRKGYVGKRPRTWVSCTADGRRAFAAHVTALQNLLRPAGNPEEDRNARAPGRRHVLR